MGLNNQRVAALAAQVGTTFGRHIVTVERKVWDAEQTMLAETGKPTVNGTFWIYSPVVHEIKRIERSDSDGETCFIFNNDPKLRMYVADITDDTLFAKPTDEMIDKMIETATTDRSSCIIFTDYKKVVELLVNRNNRQVQRYTKFIADLERKGASWKKMNDLMVNDCKRAYDDLGEEITLNF